MGTRSLTFVYDGINPVVNMYRQYDGYPEGHGAELAEFLKSGKITNGIPLGENKKFFNGIGDVAAQLVAEFKKEAGGIYLYPATALDCGQDYEYHVELTSKGFNIRVVNRGCNFFGMQNSDVNETIFDGSLYEFAKFCNSGVEFELNDESVESLKENLHKGVVEVTFQKNDGSERVMKCTLQDGLVPKFESTGKVKRHNPDVLAVWDIESDGWRSFRWDSVINTKVL